MADVSSHIAQSARTRSRAPGPTRALSSPKPAPRQGEGERGSGTVWAVCVLLLVSAAVGASLLWVAAESTRHAAERAADTAALTATSAALRGLAMRDNSDPCAAAARAATQAGARLIKCGCAPLDCTVTVRRSPPVLGAIAARLPGFAPVDATSRAGPAGESAGDDR